MAQYIANAHGVTMSVNLALPLGYVLHVQRLFMGLRPSPPVIIGSPTSGTPLVLTHKSLSRYNESRPRPGRVLERVGPSLGDTRNMIGRVALRLQNIGP